MASTTVSKTVNLRSSRSHRAIFNPVVFNRAFFVFTRLYNNSMKIKVIEAYYDPNNSPDFFSCQFCEHFCESPPFNPYQPGLIDPNWSDAMEIDNDWDLVDPDKGKIKMKPLEKCLGMRYGHLTPMGKICGCFKQDRRRVKAIIERRVPYLEEPAKMDMYRAV